MRTYNYYTQVCRKSQTDTNIKARHASDGGIRRTAPMVWCRFQMRGEMIRKPHHTLATLSLLGDVLRNDSHKPPMQSQG